MRGLEMVVADLFGLPGEHRDPIAETRFEIRIGVDVDRAKVDTRAGNAFPDGRFHLCAEMAVGPSVEDQQRTPPEAVSRCWPAVS